MSTQQPEALAQECADYATSLRSGANVANLKGRAPSVSFLRAADLFERAASRITELESQLAQRFDAADSVLYDPKAVLDVFHSARAGSEKPVGYLRGIRAVIAHWESRPEPHRWMVPARADSVQEDAARLDWIAMYGTFGVDSATGEAGGNGQKHIAATRKNIDAARKQGATP